MPLMIKKRKKEKNRKWNWHWFIPIVVEDDIIFFHFFSWHTDLCFETYHPVHLKAKVCIQDQMTEGLKLIMISVACIDKEYCISTLPFLLYSWKITLCSSIMVSALDSGWRGLGLRPCQVILLCSSTKHFILTMPLSTQEYEWILANSHGSLIKCWGVT